MDVGHVDVIHVNRVLAKIARVMVATAIKQTKIKVYKK